MSIKDTLWYAFFIITITACIKKIFFYFTKKTPRIVRQSLEQSPENNPPAYL